MYDTLNLWLENRYAMDSIKYLRNIREQVNPHTGECTAKGNLKNIRCFINSNGISLKGSMAKFYYGDNLQQLGRKDVSLAIEKLSDSLNLSVKDANVYRIDIGSNFTVKDEISSYLNSLGKAKFYKKSTHSNSKGLVYSTSLKALSFYDKVEDLKKHKIPIPYIYRNCNILRYEFRLTKRINKTLKKEKVYAEDLHNSKMYMHLIDLWKQEYFSIQRINNQKLINEVLTMLDARKLSDLLAIECINKNYGGTEKFIDMIKDAKDNNKISKDKYYKLRKKILEISNDPAISEPNEAILELDEKVRNTNLYYR